MPANSDAKRKLVALIGLLIGVAGTLMVLRYSNHSVGAWLCKNVTLESLIRETSREITPVLFVPMGAMLVVFVRRTLGLRIMGPFRSILLAVAFQATGVLIGIGFLAFAVLCVSAIRPAARRAGLGYYGRITLMLSSVAVLMACAVMVGRAWEVNAIQSVAHFPIVVLCLVADAFSRTREKEGNASAIWRVFVTAVVALPLAFITKYPIVASLLTSHPELLLVQIALIIVFSEFMNWQVLGWMNPMPDPDAQNVGSPSPAPVELLIEPKPKSQNSQKSLVHHST